MVCWLRFSTRVFAVITLVALGSPATVRADPADALKTYQAAIRPILEKNCFRCHGSEKQKAKLRLDTLNPDLTKSTSAETWHDVLNNLNLGDMPPEDEPPLTDADRKALVGWLTGELKRAADLKKQTGGKVVLRRLTRYEYNNTMRDLLGLDLDFAANLPPEPKSKDGFKNNGQALGISPIQMEYYLSAARSALSKAIAEGSKPEVVQFASSKSEKPRKPYTAAKDNCVLPGDAFLVRTLKFPREGLVRVRVTVDAVKLEGSGYPRLQVNIGHRADVHSPELPFGEVDLIPDPSGEQQTIEFTGRIESLPLPGHNPKYPGLIIAVTNAYDPGINIKTLRGKQATAERTAKKLASKRAKLLKAGKPIPDSLKVDPPKITIPVMPSFVVKSIEFDGPIFESWPPASHTNILFDRAEKTTESNYARAVIKRFIDRAYRRPSTPKDVDAVHKFYESIRPQMPSFERAMREALAMVLISPEFLYLAEPTDTDKANQRLTDHELASRLSYFLWSTMPDDQLRAAADRGQLSNATELEKQVRRMIADERSQAFVEHFTNQWLDLSGLDRVAVNPEYYPDFDDGLKQHMKAETLHFFAEVLQKNMSAMALIDSDFVMLNAPLARHYGLSGPKGMAFERVNLNAEDRRGGLLTQASMLLINSTGEDSHPIRRAVWIRDRLLDDPPAPPPPDVPELKAEDPNFAALPLKRQLELHREKASCNDCHTGIDPWGIPFESFDAVGRWREQVNRIVPKKRGFIKSPVVTESTLPGGHKVSNANDLKTYLTTHRRRHFARALVRKILAYSLGRSLEFSDHEQVDALVKQFEKSDLQLRELLVYIAKSKAFSSK